ncbi:MAG: preQ(1) synthase [Saprospiraceae bacterium]
MENKNFKLLGNSGGEMPLSPSQSQLETFDNNYVSRNYIIQFDCLDFTSLCPVTGQPDFAEIEIKYTPNIKCVETKSLKYYLHSYRNTKAFNEQVINRILDDLIAVCEPKWMKVKGKFAARGGIALTTIAEYPNLSDDEK